MAARKRPVVWSPEARVDLAGIWEYYAEAATVAIADRIAREIGRATRFLEHHPFGGRPRDEIRPGLRSVLRRPYVIFYRIGDGETQIVRVIDGRRDLDESSRKIPSNTATSARHRQDPG